MTKVRVVIESPYAGDVERNEAYARRALHHSLTRDEAPIASHLLHTQVLDDTDVRQRATGMKAGLAWIEVAHTVVLYTDYGVSSGMATALALADSLNIPAERRSIGKNPSGADARLGGLYEDEESTGD